ncbi:2-dehydro-3-deoxygalactonokinase [Alishewanella sp. HL-SH05]|uniref:2-dehydro-3-deoxygalactonokinase n=1 Tax=Alishewanella sp. HL-SH05 TaxID=3461145 RepID=UPI004041DC44
MLKRFIAVDWGTTRLRAYCCEFSAQGEVQLLASAAGPGVKKVQTSFPATLSAVIAPFIQQFGQLPVLMAGQISSSIGWFETDYLNCPVSPQAIKPAMVSVKVDELTLHITPGLRYQSADGQDDTMRGEELQLLGLLKRYPHYQQGQHLICLPGTHCKWVILDYGKVHWFKTAITGELFDIVIQHSILLPPLAALPTDDTSGFLEGCTRSLADSPESLVHSLFSVRTKQLFTQCNAATARNYLSGLLIGADIKTIMQSIETASCQNKPVVLIGTGQLQQAYANALAAAGKSSTLIAEQDVALAGFGFIAADQTNLV